MSAIVEIEELGRRIRKVRIEQRMTLKQVENASGLSATHLSEIERGRTSPTIGALVRISRALHKDASFFIESEEREDVAHVRGGVGSFSLPGGIAAESLTPGIPGSRVFAYRIRLKVGANQRLSLPEKSGEAPVIFFVRSGVVEARFGETKTRVTTGDAIQAKLSVPHEIRAAEGEAEILVMTTSPLDGTP